MVEPPEIGFETPLPKVTEVIPGKQTELVCAVYGRPPPTIRWLKNGVEVESVKSGNELERLENLGIPTLQTAITKSRLSIDCAEMHGVYTCSADNGYKKIEGNTTLKLATGLAGLKQLKREKTKITEMCSVKKRKDNRLDLMAGSPAKIVMWTDTRMEQPDAVAQLFCRANGNPKPKITWYHLKEDGEQGERIIDGPQYTLLKNGDLMVKGPQPEGEGGFSYQCVAKNAYGKDNQTVLLLAMPLQ